MRADDVDRHMNGGERVRLVIWGAGGSAPTGSPSRCIFGGDTVCFELRLDDGPPLIVDMGSGARALGKQLARKAMETGESTEAEVLISHLHLDHVVGLPVFWPLYEPDADIRIRCGIVETAEELQQQLTAISAPPYFPIAPLKLRTTRFETFGPREGFEACGFEITPIPLNHPGGCSGFRIEAAGCVVCIVGDHEHGDPKIDALVREMVQGADLMLYDGCFDESEYPKFVGWGHSTWQAGVALAEEADVAQVLLHHHWPEHDDKSLEARDAAIRAASGRAALARQDMTLELCKTPPMLPPPD